jgi:hypothetical protein
MMIPIFTGSVIASLLAVQPAIRVKRRERPMLEPPSLTIGQAIRFAFELSSFFVHQNRYFQPAAQW